MLVTLLIGCDDDLTGLPDGEPDRTPVVLVPGVPWTIPERPIATPIDPPGLADLGHTDALVVLHHGQLVYEHYGPGITAQTPLLSWSVTKSLTNSLIGIAVGDGLIDVNAPAARYYPPMDQPGLRDVRVTDLLRMSSGMAWDESYETSPVESKVLQMLYTRGHRDMALFAATRGMEAAPGTKWEYSSGTTNVLMAVLKGALPPGTYDDFPWTRLFEPLGMTTAVIEQDGAGTFVGSSYLYASARDLGKWAQLYLDDGVLLGRRILPEGWVRYTTTLAPAYATTPVGPDLYEDNPGAQWYVNVGDPAREIPPPLPDAPADTFGAQGHWGKRIWVVPSKDLVIVRLGDDREGSDYSDAKLFQVLMPAVP